MKLARYGEKGKEKPALVDSAGQLRDLSGVIDDINLTELSLLSLSRLVSDPEKLPIMSNGVRLGPPMSSIGKFICIGLNYADHIAETGARAIGEPKIFMKATSAISGANDHIEIPKESTKLDWEVELGVVIGREAKYLDAGEASKMIVGYCCITDVSERDFQKNRGGQWTKGKSADTFGPIGPWLVTADEVVDPQNLDLWLEVNGSIRQRSNTSLMLVGAHQLVEYVSQFMSLQPGDVIATGTPSGVGLGCNPPQFLKAGDNFRLGVEGLGEQNHKVIQFSPSK